MGDYIVKMTEDFGDFVALKELWQRLHERAAFPTVFNSWDWIYSCITGFKYEKICIISIWDGIRENSLPLMIIPLFIFKKWGMPYAKTIGTEMSDYNNFLMDKNVGSPDPFHYAIRAAVKHYRITKAEITQIPDKYYSDSVLSSSGVYVNGLLSKRLKGTYTYCVNIPEDDCLKIMGKNLLKDIKKKLRRLEEQNSRTVHFDYTDQGMLDKFYQYHEEKWSSRSIFTQEKYRRFLNTLCNQLSANKQLLISSILISDEPCAISIGFILKERFYGYLTAYTAKYFQFSPGKILTYEEYIRCSKMGIKYFDFLRGAEDYKMKWSCEESETSCMNIYSFSFTGCLLFLYDGVISYLKKTKRFLGKVLNSARKHVNANE